MFHIYDLHQCCDVTGYCPQILGCFILFGMDFHLGWDTNMIVSSVNGRLRLRIPAEKLTCLSQLQQQLEALPETLAVRVNWSARSLILTYQPSYPKAEMEQKLTQLIASLVGQIEVPIALDVNQHQISRPRKHARRRDINRVAKTAAIISLPLSIGLVYSGFKRWHAITGWCFVAAAATHVFIHRKNTFR
ncbi:hypothetical protein [Shewanella putrefaciens]|uniref:hypothetical protein n=1 Tax=Shewanella putrefaciens TaxID=24 RepID=UPI0035637495